MAQGTKPPAVDWDDVKERWTIMHRGLTFGFAAQVLLDPDRIDVVDDRYDYGEERRLCWGRIGGPVYSICYTRRGPVYWIISARRASRKERQAYDEKD